MSSGRAQAHLINTLFRELHHIVRCHLGYIQYVDFNSSQEKVDMNADQFARDMLISSETYRGFLQSMRGKITWSDVERLAKSADGLPCIALGRLQNDGVLDWSDFADQVVKYPWV